MTHHATAATIAVGLALAATSAFSGGRYERCEITVADRLSELNVGDVAGITYVPVYGSGGRTSRGPVIGVKAWVSLESCKGSVVIHMNKRCRIKQTWTTGQCHIPGLKNY